MVKVLKLSEMIFIFLAYSIEIVCYFRLSESALFSLLYSSNAISLRLYMCDAIRENVPHGAQFCNETNHSHNSIVSFR